MPAEEVRKFHVSDWVVFAVMLIVSAAIGIYYAVIDFCGKRTLTTSDYLMGGRNMRTFPVAVSILVSFMSAILILGNPAEMYTAGTLYFIYQIGMVIAIILAAVLFVPLFYPLKLTSSFEYLQLRFNSRAAKLTGTTIMIVQQIIYMGIASFAPSTALEAVSGFPTWATIVTLGCVATLYTFLGGMKAVIWTDVFQAIIMVAGILAIAIQGVIKVGGLGEVWKLNEEWDRIHFWEANPDPTVRHSVWSLVIGGTVAWIGTYGVSQASVQRYSAVGSLQKARITVLLNVAGIVILVASTCLCGIVMFAYYAQKGCDPLSDKQVQNANQLIPIFVMEVLGYPGLPGLFVSCLFSGALSTLSTCLNALSTVVWEDILKPLIGDKVKERTKTWLTKILVIIFGGAGIGFAFMAKTLEGTVLQASLSFTGAASGPNLGIFLLGGFFPCANWLGCVIGGIIGLILPLWISIGAYSLPRSPYKLKFPTQNCSSLVANITFVTTTNTLTTNPVTVSTISVLDTIYSVSYLWFPSIGAVTTVIVGLIVSFVTRPFLQQNKIDSKYLIPLCDRLCCCLPESWRRSLRCGYEFQDPVEIAHNEKEMELIINDEYQSKGATDNGSDVLTLSHYEDHITKSGISGLAYRPRVNDNSVVAKVP